VIVKLVVHIVTTGL